MTHLEYDRVQNLVTKKDYAVMDAKIAAEKELFAAFDIDNKDFEGLGEVAVYYLGYETDGGCADEGYVILDNTNEVSFYGDYRELSISRNKPIS